MRNLFLLTSLATCTFINAQDNGFISGNVSFQTSKVDAEGVAFDETTTTGMFGPAAGYNLSAQHVVGLAVGISGSTRDYKVGPGNNLINATDKRNLVTISPFYRYMKSVTEKFLLYGQAKVGLGFGKETTEVQGSSANVETKLSTLDLRVGPGLVYIVADRWALSADWGVLGYASEKATVQLQTTDVVTTTSGIQATLDPGAMVIALNWLF